MKKSIGESRNEVKVPVELWRFYSQHKTEWGDNILRLGVNVANPADMCNKDDTMYEVYGPKTRYLIRVRVMIFHCVTVF